VCVCLYYFVIVCDDTVVGSVDTGHCVYDVVLKFGPSCEAFTVDIESLCE